MMRPGGMKAVLRSVFLRKVAAMPELTLQFCVVCLAELAGKYSEDYEGWASGIPGLDYRLDHREFVCDGCGQELM